jgi:hypothetical protein
MKTLFYHNNRLHKRIYTTALDTVDEAEWQRAAEINRARMRQSRSNKNACNRRYLARKKGTAP